MVTCLVEPLKSCSFVQLQLEAKKIFFIVCFSKDTESIGC